MGHYSRAFALAMYKSENFEQMNFSRQALNATLDEIQLHINYCKEFDIDEKSIYKQKESPACVAYTRYVLDCGLSGDLTQLYKKKPNIHNPIKLKNKKKTP